MTTNNSNVFAGFEQFGSDSNPGTKIEYGVNVIRVEAEVVADTNGAKTVADLIARYQTQLGLPSNVVVFVDGKQVANGDILPSEMARVNFVKPAGEKGSDPLPRIELDEESAITVQVVEVIDVQYIQPTQLAEADIPTVLFEHMNIGECEVTWADDETVTVAYVEDVVKVTEQIQREVALIRRWFDPDHPMMIATFAGARDDVVLNDEDFCNWDFASQLATGDSLLIMRTGEPRRLPYHVYMSQRWPVLRAALEERLDNMSWAELKEYAKAMSITAYGPGRTRSVLTGEIISQEFCFGGEVFEDEEEDWDEDDC